MATAVTSPPCDQPWLTSVVAVPEVSETMERRSVSPWATTKRAETESYAMEEIGRATVSGSLRVGAEGVLTAAPPGADVGALGLPTVAAAGAEVGAALPAVAAPVFSRRRVI